MYDMDWSSAGRIASLMGSIKIASHGTQNHRVSRDEILQRFSAAFAYGFD
jgi:adenosine kinase